MARGTHEQICLKVETKVELSRKLPDELIYVRIKVENKAIFFNRIRNNKKTTWLLTDGRVVISRNFQLEPEIYRELRTNM